MQQRVLQVLIHYQQQLEVNNNKLGVFNGIAFVVHKET